ncbi:helix-turn-helix transcriptional regulator [Aeromonas schubertii]|uniref:helix-turn-helix transcriptional regulator n=1 Tax=Aeromonas schubertii TaxID=652 RepID=UPI0010A88C28|nr:PAS domain-containing protein [Aeromonas schubertii]QCG49414.1 hypothetical protein E2P79_17665 [Aeromonas schubertii]
MPVTPDPLSATPSLDEEAHHLIASFEPVVDALAALFGPGCEVVLHAFDHLHASVVKIANGHVTGRKKGAPVTDFALSRITALEGETWSSYFTRTREGGLMKSASVTLRSRSGQAIGMLCVNFSLDAPLAGLLHALTPVHHEAPQQETFAHSVEDLVDQVMARVDQDPNLTPGSRNRAIVCRLYDQGIFDIKDAAQQVADRLGLSRHTIYLHIRNHKAALAKHQDGHDTENTPHDATLV